MSHNVSFASCYRLKKNTALIPVWLRLVRSKCTTAPGGQQHGQSHFHGTYPLVFFIYSTRSLGRQCPVEGFDPVLCEPIP